MINNNNDNKYINGNNYNNNDNNNNNNTFSIANTFSETNVQGHQDKWAVQPEYQSAIFKLSTNG